MGRSTPTVALASSSDQSIRSATLTQAMPPMHTVGSYARTSSNLMTAARNESLFYVNQSVEVCVSSHRWVCGIVLCVLQAGASVRVRYQGEKGNTEIGEFKAGNVRPADHSR